MVLEKGGVYTMWVKMHIKVLLGHRLRHRIVHCMFVETTSTAG